ncbi:MAG TPA: cellulase family glycosylhydrolase [Ignavibacteriaceae bacterium]|nr:cellulase family glycosylhydrolase [Ignavibacteriaceae bacterium]
MKTILLRLISFLILTAFISFYPTILFPQGYLKTSGKKIVNSSSGQEIILRGIGLGGWMLQEGYMLQTSSFANTQHDIRKKIEELIGPENTDTFYNSWLANHMRRADIELAASSGFNSIRLPMHYNLFTLPIQDEPIAGTNTWLEKGFNMVDSLLAWCAGNRIYLILDLHAAPGGQGHDAAISDYDPAKPSLWESDYNKSKTVALWHKLAERYSNAEWIGGYDLINETNWNFEGSNVNGCSESNNAPLKALFVEITNAIREVDTNHIIFIEGNCWANNFNGLTPPWDDNMVYSFHKYWNNNDQGSIQWIINMRNSYNIPIWLGESGENSNQWFTDAIKLCEQNKIGWAWWPWKKFGSLTGITSVNVTNNYRTLLNYWNNGGTKPSEIFAKNTLMEMAENLKLENCIINTGVTDAMFRQISTNEIIPYADNTIPGTVFAPDYDYGQNNFAYKDEDYDNTQGPGAASWNSGGQYRNDGVDIERCSDIFSNGFDVGWIESGEYLNFTINAQQSGFYDIEIRIAGNQAGGKILLRLDGVNIGNLIDVPATGGWQNWESIFLRNISITLGTHEFHTSFYFGGFNLNYFDFTLVSTGIKTEPGLLLKSELFQNYPNPFNPNTVIKFTIMDNDHVLLKIYNNIGEKIAELVNQELPAGNYTVKWNAENFASGIYYYSISSGSYFEHKKMILLR